MRRFLMLLVWAASIVGYAQPASEWQVHLRAMNPRPVLYEPAWIRWEETWTGDAPATDEGPGVPRCIATPDEPSLEPRAAYWLGRGTEPTYRPRKGEKREGDYLLPILSPRRHFFSTPGTYTVMLGCDKAWEGDTGSGARPRSNAVAFTTAEPTGENKAALDWAGGPGPLADLMGFGIEVEGGRQKWWRNRGQIDAKRPLGAFVDAQATFVRRFPNSVYTPYVLLHLIRMAHAGQTATEVKTDPTADYKMVSDWPAVARWGAIFLEKYARHPLADEAAYLRSYALFALGQRDEVEKLLASFSVDFPTSPYRRNVAAVLTCLRSRSAPPKRWEYETRWTTARGTKEVPIP